MSYWKGFANAYRDADDRKQELEDQQFRKDLISEERAYDRDFFFEKLAAQEQSAMRQQVFTSGMSSGGGSRGSRSGVSNSAKIGLRGITQAFPNLPSEMVASLANVPEHIPAVFTILSKKKEEAGGLWSDGMAEDVLSIVQEAPPLSTEELEEYVNTRATALGVDPDAPAYGYGKTWSELLTPSEADRVSVVPMVTAAPMKTEEKSYVKDAVKETALGILKQEELDLHAEIRELNKEEDQVAVGPTIQELNDTLTDTRAKIKEIDDNRLVGFLNTEAGANVITDMWNSGWRVDYNQVFPGMKFYWSEKEVARAIENNMLKEGDEFFLNGVKHEAHF